MNWQEKHGQNHVTTTDWLRHRTYTSPHALALIIGDARWTYAELDALVDVWCNRILSMLPDPTEKFIGLLLPNRLETVCLIHAIQRLGAILVPLNTRLTANEIGYQLSVVSCELVFIDESTKGLVGSGEWEVVSVEEGQRPEAKDQSRPQSPTSNLQSLAAVVFTSGTTSKPKGVMLSYENIFYSAMGSAYRLGVQTDDIWLSVLPLYHMGGLSVIYRSCLYGTAVSLHPRFDLDAVNRDLDHNPITLISLVPTLLHRILNSRTSWPESLRLILLGGAAASQTLVNQANALANRPLIATTYGLTESASQAVTMLPSDVQHKPASVGKPLMFTRVRIVEKDAFGAIVREAAVGDIGEVLLSGPTIMHGYYQNEDATKHALHGGELHTGDIGFLDKDGDLHILQRRSDLIISGGENIFPYEVEAILSDHPHVKTACVVGVTDAEWGHLVGAMIVWDGQESDCEQILTDHCKPHLARYKTPRVWQFVDALPQTASGKVMRRRVREMMEGKSGK